MSQDPKSRLPVEPIEHEVARIEAAGQLVTWSCPHCLSTQRVIARYPSGLPRAVEVDHEPGCPDFAP